MVYQCLRSLIAACFISLVCGECENACSGHGKCTIFDMCVCFRNWDGTDCSNRICQSGLAYVDNPLGDLNGSGALDGPNQLTIINSAQFPYGITEQYPSTMNSDMTIISNSAHAYRECSGAGICDRITGECQCFYGFEGVACQRTTCPGSPICSGHGVCQASSQLAAAGLPAGAVSKLASIKSYRLWDRHVMRGCLCDTGFTGADCSQRICPKGVDPLYAGDDNVRLQPASYIIAIASTASTASLTGYYRLGIDNQVTSRLSPKSTCNDIINAVYSLPSSSSSSDNSNILCYSTTFTQADPLANPPPENNSMQITYTALYKSYFSGDKEYKLRVTPTIQSAGYDSSYAKNKSSSDPLLTGSMYLLQFQDKIGYMPQIQVMVEEGDRRGTRTLLLSSNGNDEDNGNGNNGDGIIARSWTNGQVGRDEDYFSFIPCANVRVSIITLQSDTFIYGRFAPSDLLACLGSVNDDGSSTNHSYVYDNYDNPLLPYDYGTVYNPHLIKLTRVTADINDGYFLAAIYYDTIGSNFEAQEGYRLPANVQSAVFRVLNPWYALDDYYHSGLSGALFYVYSTKGVFKAVRNDSYANFDVGSPYIFLSNATGNNSDSSYRDDYYHHDQRYTVSCASKVGSELTLATDKYTNPALYADCLDVGELFTVLDPYTLSNNPYFINLYQAKAMLTLEPYEAVEEVLAGPYLNLNQSYLTASQRRRELIVTDLHVNWASSPQANGKFLIYRFRPYYEKGSSSSGLSQYPAVAVCSNRGLCNAFEGLCECFAGYTGQACSTQNSLVP